MYIQIMYLYIQIIYIHICIYSGRRKRKEDMLLQKSVHRKPSKNQIYWSNTREWLPGWGRNSKEVLERLQPFSIDPDIFFAVVSMLGAETGGVPTLSISSTT